MRQQDTPSQAATLRPKKSLLFYHGISPPLKIGKGKGLAIHENDLAAQS
jgi:hypothetical protein